MFTPKNPYISLGDLVEELKMKPADVTASSAMQDELQSAIFRASRWVDEYTQRDYFFHDFSSVPLQFDQFSRGVYDNEIFFPSKPIRTITSIKSGPDESAAATTLVVNQDYHFDENRIYLLGCQAKWNLSRPARVLFVRGTSGYLQSNSFPGTIAGDAVGQLSGFTLYKYTASTLYWTLTNPEPSVYKVDVYSDAARTLQVMSGYTDAAGTIILFPVNGSGLSGIVNQNYQQDGNGSVTFGLGVYDQASIPQDIPEKIATATRLVAAAFSGHNRKEVMGLDGSKATVIMSEIPKTVFQLLGRKMPILV